jgi:hypothetical protein
MSSATRFSRPLMHRGQINKSRQVGHASVVNNHEVFVCMKSTYRCRDASSMLKLFVLLLCAVKVKITPSGSTQ